MALVTSLAANAYLVYRSNSYFKEECAVRLDPAGVKTYAHAPVEAVSDRPVLLFFGDSRALMWKRPDDLSEYTIVNRGIGNQTTAQILLRFDADVPRLKPAIIVLEAGVNDLKVIAEFPERRVEIVQECEANLRRLVARCRETSATVAVVSVFHIGDVAFWRRLVWSDDVERAVEEVNGFLPSLVGDKVALFDADAVLNDEHGVIKVPFQYDFIHLTPVAYASLNEKLSPFIRSLPR